MTTTWSALLKPSSSTRSWFSVWSCSRLKPCPVRAAPTASSSSMKTIAGACFRASLKRRRMREAPNPRTAYRQGGDEALAQVGDDLVGRGECDAALPPGGGADFDALLVEPAR